MTLRRDEGARDNRRARGSSLALAALLVATGASAPADAQSAPPPGAAARESAFDALPEVQRKAIQEALIWTGDYQGVVDGAFGRRSREAYLTFARRRDPRADGEPDQGALNALFAAAARARRAAGFAIVADPTGARIGVPRALTTAVTRRPTSARYASKDGALALDTAALDAAKTDLVALAERLLSESPTRRVTYKLVRPDFVVVAGEAGRRKFYTRFASGLDAEGRASLRGFTVYTPADRPEFDRLTIAIANSFDPFPGAAPATAGGEAAISAARANDNKTPAGTQTSASAPSGGGGATAVSLGGGRYLAVLPADCAAPRFADAPARIVARGGEGLVLLEGPARPAAALLAGAGAEGPGIALGFAQDGGAKPALMAVAGRFGAGASYNAGLQAGMSGAPVFEAGGRFVGLAPALGAQRLVAGIAPARAYSLIPAARALAFASLKESGGAAAGAASLASAYAASLAPVACGK